MTLLTGVHGIWNRGYYTEAGHDLPTATAAIGEDWRRWLAEGLGRHSPMAPVPAPLPVAYYADLLGRQVAMSDDPLLLDPFARQLFVEWADEVRLAAAPVGAPAPIPAGDLTVPLRQAASMLTEKLGARCLPVVSALVRELAAYFDPGNPRTRVLVRERLADTLREHRPKVLIAHSLGSVVAYETLHAHPDLRVDLLLTLGSPLAMRRVVHDRLEPAPEHGKAARPPGVRDWANLADRGDFVAVPRRGLGTRFDGVTRDLETRIHLVDPHRAQSYLRTSEVAELLSPFL